jgi:hypothetical protein
MPVSCLDYSSALKIEATCFYRMSVDFQWNMQRYIPEDGAVHGSENQTYVISGVVSICEGWYFDIL